MGIQALIMRLEAGLKVFSKADVKPIMVLFGLQNVSVMEFHPTSLLKFVGDEEACRAVDCLNNDRCCPPSPLASARQPSHLHCVSKRRLVGARGFEPPTPCSQSKFIAFSGHYTSLQFFSKRLDIIGKFLYLVIHDIASFFILTGFIFVPEVVPRKK